VLSHAYLEIYTYALILCVERERKNCIILCVYIHVLISMFLDRKCFSFDSKAYTLLLFILMKYYVLLYLIGFSNSICVIICTYIMCHSNSIYVLS
jgi:hypothetical protein